MKVRINEGSTGECSINCDKHVFYIKCTSRIGLQRKAGLALAIDNQPRGIKVTSGKSNQRILLSLKDGNND
ncbi:hypothetical protein [Vibrio coralliirubri]|uniref:hypothetical protein n=1 Tax=Vibrio coralliirubri TaxID=1516159 RepID=UPI000639AB3F|nr:hypothetical protein [Vibrio coralliirubri]CDT84676.1 hypothetical protein VCR29J2_70116 [Vibrio coralliirubri]